MIRVLLGSALPVLGLGVAAAFFGPGLVTGPRGEPMIMAATDDATLQPATFDGEACASKLIFADPASPGGQAPGAHIIAFALRSGANDVAVEVEDYPGGATEAAKTVVLVFDDNGQLISAGDPESLHMQAVAKPCVDTPDSTPRAPI